MSETNSTTELEWVLLDDEAERIAAEICTGDYLTVTYYKNNLWKSMVEAIATGALVVFRRPTGIQYRPSPTETTIWTKRSTLQAWLKSVGLIIDSTSTIINDTIETEPNSLIHRQIKDLWNKNGKPKTRYLFNLIKKNKSEPHRFVLEYWGAGAKDRGFRWKIGDVENEMTYKTLGNIVSSWRKEETLSIPQY